jgi:hypothetical protein
MRDVEYHPPTQEITALRVAPVRAVWHEVLGAGLSAKQRALMHLGLSFYTWRTLTREGGLQQGAAVDAMTETVLGAT